MSFYDQHNNVSENADEEQQLSTTMNDNNGEHTTNDGLLRDISNYIPDYLQQHLKDVSFKDLQIPFLSAAQNDENKESIIWTEFDITYVNGKRKLFLIIAYINGFSIWDITKPSETMCLLSRRNITLKIAKFLPEPDIISYKHDPFYNSRPLIALVAEDSEQGTTLNDVSFYSIKDLQVVSCLEGDSEICKVDANQRNLVVTTKTEIRGYDPLLIKKEPQFTFPVYPSPTPFGVLTLGHRWIAYPGNESDTTVLENPSQTLAERSLDMAKNITSGLYYLGDLGVKKLSDYMSHNQSYRIPQRTRSSSSPENQEENSSNDEEPQNAGIVTIRDTATGKLLIRFRAHMKRISQMAFDSTGTLLVTAPIEGNYLHVYRIMGGHIRHLYKLYRGMTSANIHDIKFSLNSRWIAASTSNGTTHIFAINPTGGTVSSRTHTCAGQNQYGSSPEKHFYMEATQKKVQEPIVVSVCGRIHQGSLFSGDTNPKNFYSIPVSAVFWECPSVTTERILVATSKGFLCQYIMNPSESENDPEKLAVKMNETEKIDICRSFTDEEQEVSYLQTLKSSSYNEETTSSSESENQEEEDEYSQWLSNVEIETYEMPAIPLWISGQFKFKTRDEYPSLEEIGNSEDTKLDSLATSVYIRRTEPIPVIQNNNKSDYDLMQSVVMVPSAPPLTDDGFYGSILSAMETPMDNYGTPHRSGIGDSENNPPEYNPSHIPPSQPAEQPQYHNLETQPNNQTSEAVDLKPLTENTLYPSVDNNAGGSDQPTVHLNKNAKLEFKENFFGSSSPKKQSPKVADAGEKQSQSQSPFKSNHLNHDENIQDGDVETEGTVKMFGSLKDSIKTDFYQPTDNLNDDIEESKMEKPHCEQNSSNPPHKSKKKGKNSNKNNKKQKPKNNRSKKKHGKTNKTNQNHRNSRSPTNNQLENENKHNGEDNLLSMSSENNLIEEIPFSVDEQKDYDLSSSDLSL